MRVVVGLVGKKGVGKSTVAQCFKELGYVQRSFATKIKFLAEQANPVISFSDTGRPVTLNDILADSGWDSAKRRFPEVRKFLQNLGEGVRQIDPDFWVNAIDLPDTGFVVIDDVRYPNEVAVCDKVFRVTGPRGEDGDPHVSETGLDDWDFPVIRNTGSVSALMETVMDSLEREGAGELRPVPGLDTAWSSPQP